jgi:hypothetical protein
MVGENDMKSKVEYWMVGLALSGLLVNVPTAIAQNVGRGTLVQYLPQHEGASAKADGEEEGAEAKARGEREGAEAKYQGEREGDAARDEDMHRDAAHEERAEGEHKAYGHHRHHHIHSAPVDRD